MKSFDKTLSFKKNNKKYVNDVERSRIYVIDKNNQYLKELDFCILHQLSDKKFLIRQGLDIKLVEIIDEETLDLLEMFVKYEKPKKVVKKPVSEKE